VDDFRSGAGSPSEPTAATSDEVRFRTIVAPLDGSPAAERAVPLARHIADLEGAPLLLLRVIPYPEPPLGSPSHGSRSMCVPDPPPEIAAACEDAAAYLERVAQGCGGQAAVRTIVLTGDPFTRIVAEIGRWSRPLVLLSAHAADAPSTGDRSELARRIASLPGIYVLIVPHEEPSGSPAGLP
jgi:nucleotide-binding universal stress UspA family protein